ncbi:Polycystin Cation Channel (PCC) Family [Thraustotheca clavata]|uniref:Polycystin Cation Channel (PCC) Family n=1 Tax=Thraustotheca clavata TaxID=74557 RepID=A0A1V9ZVP8_9STRA|nr:Polycystin Cation Channel (PCC) Family [Thraustotheca clavata]
MKIEQVHPEESRAAEKTAWSEEKSVKPARESNRARAYGSAREAVAFLLFLSLFVAVTVYNRGSSATFYYSDGMQRALASTGFPSGADSSVAIKLNDVQSMGDVWNWLQGPFANTYFPLTTMYVARTNQIVGNVRLRQVRVTPNSCTLQTQFAGLLSYCYGDLTSSTESTAGFGPVINAQLLSSYMAYTFASNYFGSSKSYTQLMQCISSCEVSCGNFYGIDKAQYATQYSNACSLSCTCFYSAGNCVAPASSLPAPISTFNWTRASDTQSSSISGVYSSIPGSGFVVDLPLNASDARNALNQLKQAKYLDIATRAVVIEAAVFNPYLELFDLIVVLIEFPPTGSIYTTFSSTVLNLSAYTSSAIGKSTTECLLAIGVLMYALEMLYSMLRHTPRRYLSSKWTIIHVINIALFIAVITIRLVGINYIYGSSTTNWTTISTSTLLSKLRYLAKLYQNERSINAINAALMWILLLKYTQVSQQMYLLLQVVTKAGNDLVSFILLFFICIIGYAQAGYIAFSTQAPSFSTFGQAIITLLQALRFRLDYNELAAANNSFAPIYFASFYLLIILIAMNMFVAILQEAFMKLDKDKIYKFYFPFENGIVKTLGFYIQRYLVSLKYGQEAAKKMELTPSTTNINTLDRSTRKTDVHPWMMMEMQALTERVQGMLKVQEEKKMQYENMETILRSIEDSCLELKVTKQELRNSL